MDVTDILAEQAQRHDAVTVDKDIDLQIDAGYLTVTDPNIIDKGEYERDTENYLQSLARDGAQALISTLLSLPTKSTQDGPLSLLPAPTTVLPRSKPLPTVKPLTKWEQFARSKGISKKTKDKKVWDEERQEWRARWGRDGTNKKEEGAWLSEVKANAAVDANPEHEERAERRARVAKNERQRLQNAARAAETAAKKDARRSEIERTVATARMSTASMGKFDKKLEGEKKPKGVKRKFDPTERSVEDEKNASLALISNMDGDARRAKKGGDEVLNVRKAIRSASKGKGSMALAHNASSGGKRSSKSKPGKKR